ncbi:response regulator transcription factor [Flavobacterium sp. LHD-85]|uniref:response regulator transcription factor n=1 Tax=Flavobacterium sp. LHD-85 TaxID=3071410 RepID=UPI0027DFE595|nr:response regulator transcription factor [Flavobacterium sp. LHD-85]MDQ6530933.1 response regulator transcription factor [Flavobacterium sp. LHD-85]
METHNQNIFIALADDQQLFLRSLATLIDGFSGKKVIMEALNGKDLFNQLEVTLQFPHIILIDVNMPVMNGEETALLLSKKYPDVKLVALSMKDDDRTIIKMIKAGCCSYLLKDIHPNELDKALTEINSNGYYNSDTVNKNLRRLLCHDEKELKLTTNEQLFLHHACSDMTYKEIASKMCLSEKTIDGYREAIFVKLNVKSRVGMALEAVRLQLISL